jgi:hypothetical protein
MNLTAEMGNQLFLELIQAAFIDTGFTIDDEELIRKKRFGIEKIGYERTYGTFYGDKFWFSSCVSKYIDPIDDFWMEFIPEMQLARGITSPPGTRFPTLIFNSKLIREYIFDPQKKGACIRINDHYECPPTEEGVHKMVDTFAQNIKSFVIPLFDVYNDIELLDACINETTEHFFEIIHLFSGVGLFYKKIIIAKLAGNKNYELLCDAYRKKMFAQDIHERVRDTEYSIFERIYKKLEGVSPLKDTILD